VQQTQTQAPDHTAELRALQLEKRDANQAVGHLPVTSGAWQGVGGGVSDSANQACKSFQGSAQGVVSWKVGLML